MQEFIDGDNKDIYEGNTGNKKYFTSSSKVTPNGTPQTSGDYYLDTSSNQIHKGSFRYVQGNSDVESFDTYLFGKIPLLKGENSSQIKFSNSDIAYWYPYDSPGINNQEGILLDYMTNISDVQLGAILPLGYISIKSGTIPDFNKADHLECYNGNRTNCYIYHRCEFGGEYHKSDSIY